jgi:hypothetical protein
VTITLRSGTLVTPVPVSLEGVEELSAFHKRTMDSLRIAFGVFVSGDVNEARKLLAEKANLRNVELAAAERHLDRLREGRPESIETTSLHLNVLRDFRRIHSHICSVAYPMLDAAGELPALRSPSAQPSSRQTKFLIGAREMDAAPARATPPRGLFLPISCRAAMLGSPESA